MPKGSGTSSGGYWRSAVIGEPPRGAVMDRRALDLLDWRAGQALRVRQFGLIWVALGLLFALAAIFVPTAVSSGTLLGMLPWASILAVAAVGETLVIQQRGLDFSVGGGMGLAIVIISLVPGGANSGILPAVLLCIGAGLVGGLVAGIGVVVFNIPSIVATLGTNAILIGAAQAISGGTVAAAPSGLSSFVRASWLGVPVSSWLALGVVVIASFCVNRTTFGRRFVASGANAEAVRASGTRLATVQVGTYVLAGACYAAAGIMYAGYVITPGVNDGAPYLLSAVAAVVMGGTALTGGRGSVAATAVACVFLWELSEVVFALGAPASTQYIVEAGVIALAMMLRPIFARRGRGFGGWWSRRRRGMAGSGQELVAVTRVPSGLGPGTR